MPDPPGSCQLRVGDEGVLGAPGPGRAAEPAAGDPHEAAGDDDVAERAGQKLRAAWGTRGLAEKDYVLMAPASGAVQPGWQTVNGPPSPSSAHTTWKPCSSGRCT